jgi:ABC-type nitrate/sulfonate/bicarbonate transport system substrate-binding protein
MYRVLAAKNSGMTSPAELAGVPIGMSQGTVIDYVTSRLLEKEGPEPRPDPVDRCAQSCPSAWRCSVPVS